jgi:hypothetical protein
MDRDDVWNGAEERRAEFSSETCALVNNASIPLTPGTPFKDTVMNLARDAGFGKFRIILNGSEIKPSQAPEVLNEGDKVEIRPYDVAGF